MATTPAPARPDDQRPTFEQFWTERRLCTVTTLRADGTPHVVPMGVVLDEDGRSGWAITNGASMKVRNIEAAGPPGAPIAVCQLEGRWWSTVEGHAVVLRDAASIAEAVRRYAARYRQPRENPARVALRITIDRRLGNVR